MPYTQEPSFAGLSQQAFIEVWGQFQMLWIID